jgi:hypothetical protein
MAIQEKNSVMQVLHCISKNANWAKSFEVAKVFGGSYFDMCV